MTGRRELTLAEYRAINGATFYAPDRPLTVRDATLYGTLTGETWWPSVTAQQRITVDLKAEASRYVNATGSGLVDAVKAAVDGAGDFRSALLTADSFIVIEHRRIGPPDGTIRSWSRRVDVTDLPSLAEYVDRDAVSDWGDES